MQKSKTTNKRLDSAKEYIDTLGKRNSKLNIVRVDLGYKKPHSQTTTLEEANNDLKHMLNNTRSKPSIFGHQEGYILKREYTEDKGIHIHAMVIFDGQKVQKSAFKADQIGKYWEKITQGKGSYHNCHRNKYDHNGIGILEHNDSDKRKILYDDVIPYFCKEEQDIEAMKSNTKDRAFTRGTLPKKKRRKEDLEVSLLAIYFILVSLIFSLNSIKWHINQYILRLPLEF